MNRDNKHHPAPPEAAESGADPLPWWKHWKFMLPIWGVIVGIIWLGIHFNIDSKVIAGLVLLIGLISNAFAWLLGIIGMVPFVGPFIVKILSVWFIWLLNGIGYLVTLVAIRRGYSKDVLTYRGVTVALIIRRREPC